MRTMKEALAVADNTHTNHPGWCQLVTRGYYEAPSVGDFDGDSQSDAEDGWKSEPATAKRFDRNPPVGAPVAFLGGSNDEGHRAISRGHGIIRSTDFDGVTRRYRAGVVGNGTIAEVEDAMNVTWAGWSNTIDGVPIPPDKKPRPLTKGWRIDKAEKLVKHANKGKPGSKRSKLLNQIAALFAKVEKH